MISDWMTTRWFGWVHGNHLVYNTCWEDPRLDRIALNLGPQDDVVVITSAGCNVLDYALVAPNHIHAVDMNPRQNALLELKLAGIRTLDFDTFFQLFGRGRIDNFNEVYRDILRPNLSPLSQVYWDKHGVFFENTGRRAGLYFHGTTGLLAWWVNLYINCIHGLRDLIGAILEADTVDAQKEIYYNGLKDRFWCRFIEWTAGRDATLALLGVPRPQRKEVERHYAGGIAGFIEDSIDAVFSSLPLVDNYFWRVYLTGEYTPNCCPEYLKVENFARLKKGLADKITIHTNTIQGFLEKHNQPISRFVLLDHMDWLCNAGNNLLTEEWQAIVNRASPDARVIWRSGGMNAKYIDTLEVAIEGKSCKVGDLLHYNYDLASELHPQDRVHTYGSFHIADLVLA